MNSTFFANQISSIESFFGSDAVMSEIDTFYSSVYASPAQTVQSLMDESECSFMELVCDIDPKFEMNLKLDTLVCCIINSDGEDAGGFVLASEAERIVRETNEKNKMEDDCEDDDYCYGCGNHHDDCTCEF